MMFLCAVELISIELKYEETALTGKKSEITLVSYNMKISVPAGSEPKFYEEVIGRYEYVTNECAHASR